MASGATVSYMYLSLWFHYVHVPTSFFFHVCLSSLLQYLLHYLLALSKWIDESTLQKSHVTTVAWALLQDSYHTTLCLRHPPSVIATAVAYLALHCCKLEVPGSGGGGGGRRKWWEVCSPESSEETLQEIASEIMAVYDARKQSTTREQKVW